MSPPHPITSEAAVEAVVEVTPWILALLLVPLTHLGSVLIIVPALAIAYLRRPKLIAPWFGAIAAYYGIMAGIKSLNEATRPVVDPPVGAGAYPELFSWWYAHATSISTTSFPSGNAMVATVLAGLITLDLDIGTRRQRALVTGTLAGLIAYSRVAIGVHFPVDAVGGVLLGLGLLGGIVLIRRRVEDSTAAILLLGAVCSAWAVWVTTPISQPPSVESIAGSNRPIAFAGAIGCLIGWHLKDRVGELGDRVAMLVVGVLAAVAMTTYSGAGIPSHPLITTGRTVVFCAAFVLIPWLLQDRNPLSKVVTQPSKAD